MRDVRKQFNWTQTNVENRFLACIYREYFLDFHRGKSRNQKRISGGIVRPPLISLNLIDNDKIDAVTGSSRVSCNIKMKGKR